MSPVKTPSVVGISPDRSSTESFLIKIECFVKLLRPKTSMRDETKIPGRLFAFLIALRFGPIELRHLASVSATAEKGEWKIERLGLAENSRHHPAGEVRRLRI